MFGDKERLQQENDDLRAEMDRLGPILDYAELIYQKHLELLADPGALQTDAFDTAVRLVWEEKYDEERQKLVDEKYNDVIDSETPKIRKTIEAEEQDQLASEAIERFETSRSSFEEDIRGETRHRLWPEIRDKVYGDRRSALEAEIREKFGADYIAEAEVAFANIEASECENVRRRVAKEVSEMTRDQLRAAMSEVEREEALLRALARDELKVKRETAELLEETRIDKIAEKARVAKVVEISDLRPGELIAVALAYREEVTRDVVPKQQRVMYFTVVDPANGLLLLTRDNWINDKDGVRKSLALPDGDVYEVGTKLRSGQISTIENRISRSLPLILKGAGTEVIPKGVSDGLEVSQIYIGGNLNTLVTTDRDRYGDKMTPTTRLVDVDLFALRSEDKVAYRFLI